MLVSVRRLMLFLLTATGLAVGALGSVSGANAQSIYVPPQFFGQHLMFYWGLNPAIPVHAMRLWDSNSSWCDIDKGTASNRYDFGQLDALLGQASRLGADVEYTFGNTPKWAATGAYPQSSATNQCASDGSETQPPRSESYWKNFVTALVTHAKGKIHAYELWNEADWSGYWSGRVSQLQQMSVDAAAIIHKIDPSALVLSPSTTATSEGYTFLHNYLSSLPTGTINAIAVHSYTGGAWPEDFLPTEINSVHSALPSAYASTPIWSTEGGWGQDSQFSSAASDQRAFVARYDLQMLALGVARSYWYAYPNTQWGTLQAGAWNSGVLTPAGTATNTVNAWLTGATLTGCTTAGNQRWCNLMTSDGRNGKIVWTTSSTAWFSTAGYSTMETLDGGSSSTSGDNGWIAGGSEPVLLLS